MNPEKKISVLFLSTYPPQACGIATFTQDLVKELEKTGETSLEIAAMNNADYEYPPEVRFTVEQHNPEAYPKAAEQINRSGADILMVEHEFGIYGGNWGEYLLTLLDRVQIPCFVTLHTVLPSPNEKQKRILKALAGKSRKIVTMASNTMEILESVYGIPKEKIEFIHHGVPEYPVMDRDTLKKESGFSRRYVISTFGLISPGKGLEYGIEATARIAKRHPELLYLILGQTHPVVKQKYGEEYREKLERTVKNFGIEKNVQFVNRYLAKEEVIRYLQLSDIYMTPYLGKDQAVSGTLAYAAGYGRVIVSTPYLYAQEMLADGRGLLAKFRSPASLADCIRKVMENPQAQAEMEKKTRELGKDMIWSAVAKRYVSLFKSGLKSSP